MVQKCWSQEYTLKSRWKMQLKDNSILVQREFEIIHSFPHFQSTFLKPVYMHVFQNFLNFILPRTFLCILIICWGCYKWLGWNSALKHCNILQNNFSTLIKTATLQNTIYFLRHFVPKFIMQTSIVVCADGMVILYILTISWTWMLIGCFPFPCPWHNK